MKSYVIVPRDIKETFNLAERVILSGKEHNLNIDMEYGYGIKDEKSIKQLYKKEGLPYNNFDIPQSYPPRIMVEFYNHYSLWKMCIHNNESLLILDYNVIIESEITYTDDSSIQILCEPIGTSYIITPSIATQLVSNAKTNSTRLDRFLQQHELKYIHPKPIIIDNNYEEYFNE